MKYKSETNQEHREPIPLSSLPLGTTVVDADGNTYWLNMILCNERSEPWTVELSIVGMNLCLKIDTGADISVISQATYHQLPQKPLLQPCKLSLMSLDVESAGEFIAHTKLGNDVYITSVLSSQHKQVTIC